MTTVEGSAVESTEEQDQRSIHFQMWTAFGKSLILPLVLVVFYFAAPYSLTIRIQTAIESSIDKDPQLSATDKIFGKAKIDQTDFIKMARSDSADSELKTALIESGDMEEFQLLSYAYDASLFLLAILVVGQITIFALNSQAKKSDESLIVNYKIAWSLAIILSLLNLVISVPLLAYGCFELTVLLFSAYFPKIIFLIVIGGVAILWTSISLLLRKIPMEFQEPMSREILPTDAPELWQIVNDTAHRLNTAPPDKIISGVQFNFYVTELSVIHDKGRTEGRTLYMSYPLMKHLSRDELVAVIGHEMGHFIGKDTALTQKFFPIYQKARATLMTLAHGGWVGWPSLQMFIFFYLCFEHTSSTRSRAREFHADALGASITSPRTLAQSLVKIQVFSHAFNLLLKDSMSDPSINPMDLDLRSTVRARFVSDEKIWTDLFKQRMPHPLDSHPTLRERLEALGEKPSIQEAQAMTLDEIVVETAMIQESNAVFQEIKSQAVEHVQLLRSATTIKEAVYLSKEGKELLDSHFPPQSWKGKPVANQFPLVVSLIALAALVLINCFIMTDYGLRVLICFPIGICALMAYIFWNSYQRIKNSTLELNAGGITYSLWNRPLHFDEVAGMTMKDGIEKGVLVVILTSRQTPFSNSRFKVIDTNKAEINLNFTAGEPQDLAQTIFRYYKRQAL